MTPPSVARPTDLFVREGYIYDYVFDWTVLKHHQDEEKERAAAVASVPTRVRDGRIPDHHRSGERGEGGADRMDRVRSRDRTDRVRSRDREVDSRERGVERRSRDEPRVSSRDFAARDDRGRDDRLERR